MSFPVFVPDGCSAFVVCVRRTGRDGWPAFQDLTGGGLTWPGQRFLSGEPGEPSSPWPHSPRVPCRECVADTPAEAHVAPLARFVGEWEVDGKWSDGSELHARAVYTRGVNNKIIVGKTFVKDPAKGEYQRYEGILAWHPKKKSLYEVSFAYNGDISEVLIDQPDKDTLHFGYRPFNDGDPAKVRQIIHFTGDDAFVWTVSLKTDSGWNKIMEATWHRKAK